MNSKNLYFWGFIFLLLILLIAITGFNESYTKVGGEWVTNTPVPTPTSYYFTIEARIKTVELKGSQFDGFTTWVTMEVILPINRGSIDRPTSITFGSGEYAYLLQQVDKVIVIDKCKDVGEDGIAYCEGEYTILGD